MKTPRQRKPRFKRVADLNSLRITSRDLCILKLLAEHRFLQSHQIARLVPGSEQHLVRRLGKLYHSGMVDRPSIQRFAINLPRQTFVYSLSPAGARLLQSNGESVPKSTPRSRAGALAHALTHDVFAAEIMVEVKAAAVQHETQFAWIRRTEREKSFQQMRWACRVSDAEEGKYCSVIPDAAFSLTLPDQNPSVFFLEYDRGTMPIHRRSLSQSSFFRKILAYKETSRGGILFRKFGINGFRVLVVTESETRMKNLQAEVAKSFHSGKSELFLFRSFSNSPSRESWDAATWENCLGESRKLV